MNIIEACQKYIESRGLEVLSTNFSHSSGLDITTEVYVTIIAEPKWGSVSQDIDPDVTLEGSCPVTNQHYRCKIASISNRMPSAIPKPKDHNPIIEPMQTTIEFTCFI